MRGRERDRLRDSLQCAEQGCEIARRRGNRDNPQVEPIRRLGKMEEITVHGCHVVAEPRTDGYAESETNGHDDQDELQVVEKNAPILIAQGLERGDLLALRRDLTAQRDMQQEADDPEEYARQTMPNTHCSLISCESARCESCSALPYAPPLP